MNRSQVECKKTVENKYTKSTSYNFKSYLIVFVAIFGIIMVGSFNNSYADYTVTSVPTGISPTSITFTSNYIYVTNYGSNTVSVIDGSNNVVGSISVGAQPYGIVYDSYNGKIYVANYGSNTVSVIDPSSNTVISTISGVTNPSGLTYDSTNNDIYVTNYGSNTVSVIDPSSNNVINTISVSAGPISVTYSTNNIYVSNFYSNTVSVINGTSNTVTTTIAVGQNPYGIVYDNYNGKIYVANSGDNTVSVIDTSPNTPPTPTVNKIDPFTTVVSSVNPSVIGQSITFTATVTSPDGIPTGTVNFMDGITNLGSCTLSGNSCTPPSYSFSIGDHSITASYVGDANFNPSTSTPLTQTISKADPFTTVVSSVNPSVIGQSITFTATVTSPDGIPTGTVTFFDGSTILGTGTLNGGVVMFSTSSLSPGSHHITASYSDNSNYEPSTNTALTQTVQYKFGGFKPPVIAGSQYNLGRTIPIKFQVFNANNNLLTTATGTVSVDGVTAFSSDNILQGNIIHLNGLQYAFNMNTKGLAAGSHTVTVSLNDGSVH
ncbi:MAG TPA: Ig-like domain repeat protein, partial [Nitrosopumilaceae archaeon]|nr:Ig-like domain repeat protein [Nitrosopumilaceae archaeon]